MLLMLMLVMLALVLYDRQASGLSCRRELHGIEGHMARSGLRANLNLRRVCSLCSLPPLALFPIQLEAPCKTQCILY